MKRNFTQIYNIIYDIFKKSEFADGLGFSKLGLARLLGVSQGKTQHWERGQWPSADDLMVLHNKLGLSYRWLVTGEGDPFDDAPKPEPVSPNPIAPALPPPAPDMAVELERLRKELEESNRLNRQLVTRLLIDGTGDKPDAQNSNPKAAGL